MSTAARIEELQRKFDENPRRYFAPLANECRKAGDLEAAIAICRTHLPQQPGHMSGHIVFGQALYEAGELEEARSVFETALTLDPENLIALRHLGDIAARSGDPASARQWYARVLETDPRNEEIQGLMAALDGAPADGVDPWAADASPIEPVEPGLPAEIDPALIAAAADVREADVRPADIGGAADPGPPNDLLDLEESFSIGPTVTEESAADAGRSAPREEMLEPTSYEFEAPAAAHRAPALEGLETSTFETPPPALSDGIPSITEEAQRDREALDIERPLDFEATGFGATGLEPTGITPPPPLEERAPEALAFDGPSVEETLAAPSFALEPDDASPLQNPPTPPADAFVTETMAELYLQQGYREQALDVYRQLVAQSPNDHALRERMARVEGDEGAGTIADAFATEDVDAIPLDEASIGDLAPASSGTLPGLPEAMEPALVDAAADAREAELPAEGPATFEPAAAAPPQDSAAAHASLAAATGVTVRQFLSALAAGERMPLPSPITAAPRVSAEPETLAPAPDESMSREPAVVTDTPGVAPADVEPSQPPMQASTSGDTGAVPGKGLSALFGSGVAADDARAADVLADAFVPAPPPTPPASVPAVDPLSGRPARPAGSDLSLDHVFGQPRQQGNAANRQTGGFSFDQFFAEGALKPAKEGAPSDGAPSSGGDDDIEQFNAWLQGLKKQ